jgi:hypothetical protein
VGGVLRELRNATVVYGGGLMRAHRETKRYVALILPNEHPYWAASAYEQQWAIAIVEAFAAFAA